MNQTPVNKDAPKMPIPPQRPPMGGPKMAMNSHNKGPKPGNNFSKPTRVMRAAKGR